MKSLRERYLQKLIARKGNGLVKVITGIRRCGKSFLLFTLFKEHLQSEGVDARHLIVTSGSRRPLEGEDGIITVGVIPFLLDRTILTGEAAQADGYYAI